MTTDEISGQPKIPVAEVEGLVEEWREIAECIRRDGDLVKCMVIRNRADELEELIGAYQYE